MTAAARTFASLCRPRRNSSSSMASTRSSKCPRPRASKARLTRPGSSSTNSLVSRSVAIIAAGVVRTEDCMIRVTCRCSASRGSKVGSRVVATWSRFSSALPSSASSGSIRRPASPARTVSWRTSEPISSSPRLASAARPTSSATARPSACSSKSGNCWPRLIATRVTSSGRASASASSSLTSRSRTEGAIRAIIPMSSSTRRPSGVTSTLPGCGSAWKVPWSRTWST